MNTRDHLKNLPLLPFVLYQQNNFVHLRSYTPSVLVQLNIMSEKIVPPC